RVVDVRVRVDVYVAQLPDPLELVAVEERGRDRQAVAERLADHEHVGELGPGPELSRAAEPSVDRVDTQERAPSRATAAEDSPEVGRRQLCAASRLHPLDEPTAAALGPRTGGL